MPKGVYIRTEKQIETIRELGKLPKTQAQIEAGRENLKRGREIAQKLPKSQKQIEACRSTGKLPRTQKQMENARKNLKKGLVFGNTIIKHHNDLQHGILKPHDVSYMTSSEHSRLHANMRVENGTHHFLNQNREAWCMK